MENVDFGKIVSSDTNKEKDFYNDSTLEININLSGFWGARRVKLEGEVSEFCDEDGNEDFICIPIHRNGLRISETMNNVYAKIFAKRQIYPNTKGTHFLTQSLTKEILDLRESLGFKKVMIGYMNPTFFKHKKK